MTERAWRVEGRVQGVGFRWWVVKTGARLGMAGRVWNAADGAVVLHVRGSEGAVKELRDRLAVGPVLARPTEIVEIPAEGPWPRAGIEIVG